MAIVKAEATYSDGSSAVFTGDPLDLSTIPTLSPDELASAETAKNLAAKNGTMDEETKTDAEVSQEPAKEPVAEAPVEAPAETPEVKEDAVNG